MTFIRNLLILSVLAVGTISAGAPAEAGCFEDGIGCTDSQYIPKPALGALSCDSLWTVRNTIYNERGYCFRSARAIEVFSNEDCTVNNPSNLQFNKYERTNLSRIVAVEKAKGCR